MKTNQNTRAGSVHRGGRIPTGAAGVTILEPPLTVAEEEQVVEDAAATALSAAWQNDPDLVPAAPAPAPGWDRVEPDPAYEYGL